MNSIAAAAYFRLMPDRGAVPALDGLRGVAILLVVLHHAAESFVPPGGRLLPVLGWDAATPLLNGWMGVTLFFVLSGFLITHHLLRRWTGPVGGREIRVYLLKRWLRIVPTYYVVLLIVAASLVPHYPVDADRLGARVAYHLLFLQDYLPSGIVAPFWSLGVEEKFYLVMPIVMLACWRLATPRAGLGTLVALALLPLGVRIVMAAAYPPAETLEGFTRVWRNPFHLSLDALMLGAIAAWLVFRGRVAAAPAPTAGEVRLYRAGLAATGLLLATRVLPQGGGGFDRVLLFPLTALAMAMLLLGVYAVRNEHGSWLRSVWLRRAGRVAFPWYLTHVPVMWWVWGTLLERAPGVAAASPLAQFAVFLPLFLVTSAAAAVILHFAVEKPCLILKDRVGTRRAPAESPLSREAA